MTNRDDDGKPEADKFLERGFDGDRNVLKAKLRESRGRWGASAAPGRLCPPRGLHVNRRNARLRCETSAAV